MKINSFLLMVFLLAISVVITYFDTVFLNQKRKGLLNENCTAFLEFHDTPSGFSARINIFLVMRNQKYGYIDMSGHVTHKGENYTLSREIKFIYKDESPDIYEISRLTLIKQASDTTPNELMDSIFFSMNYEMARHMTVRRIRNAYVIGNLHSPVFMCVVKS